MIGFDTGFFVKLIDSEENQIQMWSNLKNTEKSVIVSCLSFFELERLALKGRLDKKVLDVVIQSIPDVCEVVWLTPNILSQAAKISHGNGIPSIDALILTSLITSGATEIYTTDKDMGLYKQKRIKVTVI